MDKILDERKTKGRGTEYLVSYLNYPKKFNTWIKKSDLIERDVPVQAKPMSIRTGQVQEEKLLRKKTKK